MSARYYAKGQFPWFILHTSESRELNPHPFHQGECSSQKAWYLYSSFSLSGRMDI